MVLFSTISGRLGRNAGWVAVISLGLVPFAGQSSRTAMRPATLQSQGQASLMLDRRSVPPGALLLLDSEVPPVSYSATGMTLAVDTGVPVWESRSDSPIGHSYGASSVVPQLFPNKTGDSWYVSGVPGPTGLFDGLLEYQAGNDVWIPRARMRGGPRTNHAQVTVNGMIYVLGGYDAFLGQPTDRLERYDPATDIWSSLAGAALPFPSADLAAVVVNGVIHIMGGTHPVTGVTADHYTLDLAGSGGWTPAASLLSPVLRHAAVVTSDNTIVVTGGRRTLGSNGSDMVQILTPGGTWQLGPTLPGVVSDHASVALGYTVYVLGGRDALGGLSQMVSSVVGKSWKVDKPMLQVRQGGNAAMLNGQLFVALGQEAQGSMTLNVEAFVPGRKVLHLHRKN